MGYSAFLEQTMPWAIASKFQLAKKQKKRKTKKMQITKKLSVVMVITY